MNVVCCYLSFIYFNMSGQAIKEAGLPISACAVWPIACNIFKDKMCFCKWQQRKWVITHLYRVNISYFQWKWRQTSNKPTISLITQQIWHYNNVSSAVICRFVGGTYYTTKKKRFLSENRGKKWRIICSDLKNYKKILIGPCCPVL